MSKNTSFAGRSIKSMSTVMMTAGKHQKNPMTFKDLMENDPKYTRWLLAHCKSLTDDLLLAFAEWVEKMTAYNEALTQVNEPVVLNQTDVDVEEMMAALRPLQALSFEGKGRQSTGTKGVEKGSSSGSSGATGVCNSPFNFQEARRRMMEIRAALQDSEKNKKPTLTAKQPERSTMKHSAGKHEEGDGSMDHEYEAISSKAAAGEGGATRPWTGTWAGFLEAGTAAAAPPKFEVETTLIESYMHDIDMFHHYNEAQQGEQCICHAIIMACDPVTFTAILDNLDDNDAMNYRKLKDFLCQWHAQFHKVQHLRAQRHS